MRNRYGIQQILWFHFNEFMEFLSFLTCIFVCVVHGVFSRTLASWKLIKDAKLWMSKFVLLYSLYIGFKSR
jgi:hypothetical protein